MDKDKLEFLIHRINITLENDWEAVNRIRSIFKYHPYKGTTSHYLRSIFRNIVNRYAAEEGPFPIEGWVVDVIKHQWENYLDGLVKYPPPTQQNVLNCKRSCFTNPKKEKTMESKQVDIINVESKVFIDGVEAATFSDDQIFERIATVERQIKRYEGIESKPKKLEKRIADMKKGIADLIKYVDSRK